MSDEMDCDVCSGTGKPVSGLPCICGGTGSNIDEKVGLRRKVHEMELQNSEMREVIQAALIVNSLPLSTPRGDRERAELRFWAALDEYQNKRRGWKCQRCELPMESEAHLEECDLSKKRNPPCPNCGAVGCMDTHNPRFENPELRRDGDC